MKNPMIEIASKLALGEALDPIYNRIELGGKISLTELNTIADQVYEILKDYARIIADANEVPDMSWVKDYEIGKRYEINGTEIRLSQNLNWHVVDHVYKYGVLVCPPGIKSLEEAYKHHLKVRP